MTASIASAPPGVLDKCSDLVVSATSIGANRGWQVCARLPRLRLGHDRRHDRPDYRASQDPVGEVIVLPAIQLRLRAATRTPRSEPMTTMRGQPSKLVPSDSRSPSTPIRRTAGLRRILLGTEDAHAVYARAGFAPLAKPDKWMALQ
jgi:hypothetical protein